LLDGDEQEETPVNNEIKEKTAALEVHFDEAVEVNETAPETKQETAPTADPVNEPNKLF
jgi:hypothetical protein